MKTITFIYKSMLVMCLPCINLTTRGQTVNTNWATQINETFAGVDKDKVPYSLLKDYAMEFTELETYSGVLTDTSYVNRGTLESIYKTLIMSRVKTNVTSLIDPSLFEQNWTDLRKKDTLVLSGLYYKYSQFKSDAYPNYITVSNDKLYDKYVNGVWQDPYEEAQVFAISSPILKYKGLTVNVELPQSLWYTNQSSTIQSIAIDFNDGSGYIDITFGNNYSLVYTEEGVYDWVYKLTLSNGQVLYSHGKIIIEETAPTKLWINRSVY